MTVDPAQVISNACGLVGTLCLTVPALRLNSIAKKISHVSKIEFSDKSDPFFNHQVVEILGNLTKLRDSWTSVDQSCLFAGLALLFISYLINIIAGVQ